MDCGGGSTRPPPPPRTTLLLEILRTDIPSVLDVADGVIIVHAVDPELVNAQSGSTTEGHHGELDVGRVVPEAQSVLDRFDRHEVSVRGDVAGRGPLHVHELVVVVDQEVGVVLLRLAASVDHDHPELVVLVPVAVSHHVGAVQEVVELSVRQHALQSVVAAASHSNKQDASRQNKSDVLHLFSFGCSSPHRTDFQGSLRTQTHHNIVEN